MCIKCTMYIDAINRGMEELTDNDTPAVIVPEIDENGKQAFVFILPLDYISKMTMPDGTVAFVIGSDDVEHMAEAIVMREKERIARFN